MIRIKSVTDEIDKLANRVLKKSKDFSPATKEIAGIMLDTVEQNFEEEGRPVKWSGLAESTKKQRAKKGTFPGKMLQVTGQLASSIQADHDKTTATVSTNQFHGPIHHFGGKTGRDGKTIIPPRPILVLTKPDQDEIQEVLRVFLDNI